MLLPDLSCLDNLSDQLWKVSHGPGLQVTWQSLIGCDPRLTSRLTISDWMWPQAYKSLDNLWLDVTPGLQVTWQSLIGCYKSFDNLWLDVTGDPLHFSYACKFHGRSVSDQMWPGPIISLPGLYGMREMPQSAWNCININSYLTHEP
jgi:hypothetical protein